MVVTIEKVRIFCQNLVAKDVKTASLEKIMFQAFKKCLKYHTAETKVQFGDGLYSI
jgi:hypothetical protein